MSGDFSLIAALEKLYLDPFPTKKFRSIVKYIENIAIILQEIHAVKMCCIDDIIAKLPFSPKEISNNKMKNRLVTTAEIYKMLTQKQIPQKFASILVKLFLYLIIKLYRCSSEDASSILSDFNELLYCIFIYRKYSAWDNSKIDEIVTLFLKKLIKMVKEMANDNRNEKFHLFCIMRVMIMEFAKHPVYSGFIIKQLNEEIRRYYRHVKDLSTKVESYTHENYMTHLYILHEIIGKIFIHKNKEDATAILSSLQNVLNDIVALNKMNPREVYLVQNIAGIIVVFLCT